MIKSSPALSISNLDITPHAISIGLGDIVKNAHQDQLALEKKLLSDTTKTKASKQLFAYEAADKRLKQVWNKLDKKQDDIRGGMFQLSKRLDNELKINSTTDMVILNSYAPILKDMNISDITELAQAGDKDAIRAVLLVPALKLLPKFSQAKGLFTEAAEKAILGDDYEIMQELRDQQKDVDQVEVGIVKTISAYSVAAKQIQAKVVNKSEMPELG